MADTSKDQHFSIHDENSRDSDLESRLYAEIHYTNTIIGDENNFDNDINNSHDRNSTLGNNRATELESQSNLQTSQSSNHPHIQQKRTSVSAQDNGRTSRNPNTAHENPAQLQSNSNSYSKKRPTLTDSGPDESKKKKKKQQNKNDDVNDKNRIINPYHKDVNNQQQGLKLLSPAFLQLVFGKPKGKKKKAQKKLNASAQPSKVSISYDTPTLRAPRENVHNFVSKQVVQNETEASGAQDSETIIDICSESSKDSTEDNSKYNSIEATDKKLTKQNSMVNNKNSNDDMSDSSESIFEVPVPPKPAPPVIELNDSDNENNESSDTNSSSSSDESYQANSQNVSRSVSNITENLQEENSDTESSESDNLILNCTEVQKGVSSINDIKRMSRDISSKTSTADEVNAPNASNNFQNDANVSNNSQNNANSSNNSQNDVEELNNVLSTEKMTSPVKETYSSVTEEVRKSSRLRDRQNANREKSYFQPMSDKMKSFYNDSWGGENFDLENLKSKMPRDPNKWAILDDDLTLSFARRKRYFRTVCNRCQKDDHRQNQCPEPYKPPTCYMCGMKGHLERGCPEKKCLTCGKKQNMYRKTCEQCVRMICSRCKARGHMEHFCPDLWRSYHQTVNNTKPNFPKNVKTVMKPQYTLYCCNCAKKGHDSQNCKKLRWSEHFPVPPHVTSYNGPEYSKENVGTKNNLNKSNSFRENSLTHDNSLDNTEYRNSARDKLTSFPKNQILDADRNIIFKIKSIIPESGTLVKKDFRLLIGNKDEPSKFNYWNGLSTFLYKLVKQLSGEFLLRQNNQNLVMEMCVNRKYKILLERLIQQYARRNNFERSHMFLSCDRNHMVQNLTDKLDEFSNMELSKGILELYQELISLKSSESEQASNCNEQKLILCQKELLIALYREGFADNCLQKLKKIFNKSTRLIKKTKKESLKKKQKSKGEIKMTFKLLLECLFYYNNVFVPYEPCKLHTFIGNYKKHLEQRDRLKSNPLLFPQASNNKTNESTTQSTSFSSTVTAENVLTSSSSTLCQNLLLVNTSTISQMQPINSEIQPTISSNISRPLLSINTSISSNFHFSQNPPAVTNNTEIISQNPETPSTSKGQNFRNANLDYKSMKANAKYKRFIKSTRKLIAQARNVNIPHVRKHIEILENKLKNGIYVFEKDVIALKRQILMCV